MPTALFTGIKTDSYWKSKPGRNYRIAFTKNGALKAPFFITILHAPSYSHAR